MCLIAKTATGWYFKLNKHNELYQYPLKSDHTAITFATVCELRHSNCECKHCLNYSAKLCFIMFCF